MLKKKIFAVLISIMAAAGSASAAEWKQYSSGNNMDLFYDIKSVSFRSKDSVRVWNKFVAGNEQGVKRMIQERIKLNLPVEGYENYKETTVLYEIKCSTQEIRMLTSTDFDKNGGVLDSSRPAQLKANDRDFMIPGTPVGALPELICVSRESKN